jgi:hypothetical protein
MLQNTYSEVHCGWYIVLDKKKAETTNLWRSAMVSDHTLMMAPLSWLT